MAVERSFVAVELWFVAVEVRFVAVEFPWWRLIPSSLQPSALGIQPEKLLLAASRTRPPFTKCEGDLQVIFFGPMHQTLSLKTLGLAVAGVLFVAIEPSFMPIE